MTDKAQQHCIVVTCFDPKQPGFLDFSYRLMALSKSFRLTIVSQENIKQSELLVKDAHYKVIPIAHGKIGWLKYLWECASFVKNQQPAVVVLLHSALAPITLLTGSIPTCVYWNEHPTNLIRYPSNPTFMSKWITYLSHQLVYLGARHANCVMPIGEDHEDDLKNHQVAPHQLKMIYMGVSEAFYEMHDDALLTAHSEPIRLIYVGTVSEIRGRDVMLEAMSLIAKAGVKVHLTIIGACDEQLVYCKQRIQALNIGTFVQVKGRISGELIPEHLKQADIGICLWERNPWYEFNPPTKLFEYLAAGLPVLASNIRTHTRYIHDWQNGLIFDYDSKSLAQAITSLNKYASRISALKAQARSDGQQYAWSLLEQLFLDKIHQLSAE